MKKMIAASAFFASTLAFAQNPIEVEWTNTSDSDQVSEFDGRHCNDSLDADCGGYTSTITATAATIGAVAGGALTRSPSGMAAIAGGAAVAATAVCDTINVRSAHEREWSERRNREIADRDFVGPTRPDKPTDSASMDDCL